MDWHAWLSGARLEAALVYEYALVLARNELEADDVAFFDHDLLHSMGISVAKHRLEILKLAWRDRRARSRARARPAKLARRLLGRVARCVRSLVRGEKGYSTALVLVPSQPPPPPQPDELRRSPVGVGVGGYVPKPPPQQQRRGKALRRAASEPKGSGSRSGIGGRAAAAVHAVGDVESGDGDKTVRWDRLFQDLKPN
ncbi:unnamed protein product [Urochloa humidicola]